jgi:hypothetical protein
MAGRRQRYTPKDVDRGSGIPSCGLAEVFCAPHRGVGAWLSAPLGLSAFREPAYHVSRGLRDVRQDERSGILRMDYATLSLPEVKAGLDDMARDTQATFGHLAVQQLNWRPDATRWSVAQCFEHLLTANQLMVRHAQDALSEAHRRTLWQRLPFLPSVFGRMLIRSQAPGGRRKFAASSRAQPSMSDIGGDIIQRVVEQHHGAVEWIATLDERAAARTIMASPFVAVVIYNVLDGCRLLLAHDRRHFEQARRVTLSPGFPDDRTVASPPAAADQRC